MWGDEEVRDREATDPDSQPTCVSPHVELHPLLVGKLLLADVAGVGHLAGVTTHMGCQWTNLGIDSIKTIIIRIININIIIIQYNYLLYIIITLS